MRNLKEGCEGVTGDIYIGLSKYVLTTGIGVGLTLLKQEYLVQ